jgi:hypothetical protein
MCVVYVVSNFVCRVCYLYTLHKLVPRYYIRYPRTLLFFLLFELYHETTYTDDLLNYLCTISPTTVCIFDAMCVTSFI